MTDPPAIALDGVSRSFGPRRVLHKVDIAVHRGRSLAVIGPSGAGKTTLLAILGLLDRPTAGRVLIDGKAVVGATAARAARRGSLGFVFQEFNLVPHLSVRANLDLALDTDAAVRARHLLADLGMGEFLDARPTRLSAGEQQRVAIVRALAKHPSVVLADEPTASLDPATRDQVLAHLRTAMDTGAAVVVVTHDSAVANWADTVLRLDAASGTLVPGSAA